MNRLIKLFVDKKFLVLTDQAIYSGGSFVLTMSLARLLSGNDFGIYSSFILFNFLCISALNALVISPFQVSYALISKPKSYLSFCFWSQLILVVILGLFISTMSSLNFKYLAIVKGHYLSMSILLIGFLMNDFFRKVFLAKDEIVNALIVDSSSALLQVAIVVYFHFSNPLAFDILVMMLGLAFIPSIVFGIIIIKPALIEKIELKTYSDSHIKQGKWLLLTALTQWWASNLFVVSSGIFLGVVSLGAFRLVQSLFGVLNLLLQTFENYILPKTSALWVKSQTESKSFLINISKKAGILFAIVLFVLFFFSDQVISLAGGKQYANYGYVVKGMSVLYLFIFIGYPIRIAIRMLILNRSFFEGYLISLVFSLISFKYLLATWNLWGAITGLIISQIILIAYWQYILIKNKFSLWK